MPDDRLIESLSALLLLILGAPYLLGPFLAWFTASQSAQPQLASFADGLSQQPNHVQSHFLQTAQAMRRLGFDVLGGYFLGEQSPAATTLAIVFANRTSRDSGYAMAIYTHADRLGGRRQGSSYTAYSRRFDDDSLVQTGNSAVLPVFPPDPMYTTIRLPGIQDPERLYRIHQKIADQAGQGRRPMLRVDEEFDGDAEAFLAAEMVEELNEQIGTGYMYLSSDGRHYRPTLKGAFLMTWGQLFPIKQFRLARRNREAKRWMDRLENL